MKKKVIKTKVNIQVYTKRTDVLECGHVVTQCRGIGVPKEATFRYCVECQAAWDKKAAARWAESCPKF